MSSYDVVVIGAGLAGLRAARVLEDNDLSVLLLEKSHVVGGRLASRVVDGFVLDEGFQLINPAYPELVATGILESFDLRRFEPMVRFVRGNSSTTIVDPRWSPLEALRTLTSRTFRASDLARTAKLFAHCGLGPVAAILGEDDCPTRVGLARWGISTAMVDECIEPFLRGTLLRDGLSDSWHYTQLLLRSFFRGRPGTHPSGITALPQALAERLRSTDIHVDEEVHGVTGSRVTTDERTYTCAGVIVATDPSAASILAETTETPWLGQTTWWMSVPNECGGVGLRIDVTERRFSSALDVTSVARERSPSTRRLIAVPANGTYESREHDLAAANYVARLYDVVANDVELVQKTVVAHALPRFDGPLRLAKTSRRGDLVLAGDYLQSPSIQGALVSGRRAANEVLAALGRKK